MKQRIILQYYIFMCHLSGQWGNITGRWEWYLKWLKIDNQYRVKHNVIHKPRKA